MISHRPWPLVTALLSLSLLLPASAGRAAEKVTLRLDWSYWGGHAPFFVAVEKGFFARRGLDVAVQDGKGSRITAVVVGEGKDDFGFADSTSVATGISQGLGAKVIAIITAGGSDATLLEAFLTKNNVDLGKVKLEKMPGDAKPAALLARKVHGISSQGFYNMPILEAQGAKPRQLLFADYGLPGLNYGVFTSKKMIQERPDTVRRFVAATLEGWDYAIANTEDSIRILSKHVPLLDPKVARQQFINMQKLLRTKNTEANRWAGNLPRIGKRRSTDSSNMPA